jgi:poly(A) polymerase/tRNA nucleotidyltransferase (CCA-adding enzyme)
MAVVWDVFPEARMVGGAVRDMLAGRAVADVDFAIPLKPEDILARARAAGLKAVPTGYAHGTITLLVQHRAFEMTTLRRDIKGDGRHATVAFTDDWEIDASRRDFTINAMSANRAGEIFDYFDGRKDLAAGRVRFVGQPAMRIREDYLRILRFFRFYTRFGHAGPDPEAVSAIRALKDGVLRLSAERVWREFKYILAAEDPRPALALMREISVLSLLLQRHDFERLADLVRRMGAGPALLRLAALSQEDVDAYADRWRLSGAERNVLRALSAPNRLRPGMDERALRQALAEEPAEILISRTQIGQDDSSGWDALRARLAAAERPVFPLHGRDIQALGMASGPEIGIALRSLYLWWKDNGCVADAAACREKAAELYIR